MLHQDFEDIELDGREFDRFSFQGDGPGADKKGDISHGNFVTFAIFFLARAAGAPEDSADPCDQFSGVERLGKVVVGADFETHDAIDGVAASGEQQNGKLRSGAKLLEQFESRTARQHDIQNDEFVLAFQGFAKTGALIVGGVDLKALWDEILAQEFDQVAIIVDYEQMIHRVHFLLPRLIWR